MRFLKFRINNENVALISVLRVMSIHSVNPLILTHVSNKFNPSTQKKAHSNEQRTRTSTWIKYRMTFKMVLLELPRNLETVWPDPKKDLYTEDLGRSKVLKFKTMTPKCDSYLPSSY